MNLSIVIPVYNEIKYLKRFTQNLTDAFKNENVEYIFVNDGSEDGSEEWLSNYIKEIKNKNITNFKYINLNKNKGKGFALRKGSEISTGDYILYQDSDLELDPRDSLEMYKIIKNTPTMQAIFGSRFSSGKLRTNINFINEIVVKINSLIFNILFNQSISDLHCGTKIITREVLDKIKLQINDFGFEIDIASQIAKKNFQIFEYGISYLARTSLEGKKITWIDGVLSYYYLIKVRFIDNSFSVQLSIIFSSIYMFYVGTYFGMGIGKNMIIFLFLIIGCFIGLSNKILPSSLIFLSIYFGSLFSKGNGKIYTIIVSFLIGIFLAKKISSIIKRSTKNKFIKFFV